MVRLDPSNSPVIERTAKFRLIWKAKAPIDRAEYWFDKTPQKGHLSALKTEDVSLNQSGNDQYTLQVSANSLAPGQHTFYLKVATSSWWKTAWRRFLSGLGLTQMDPDFPSIVVQTAFSIDASLEVPDPGEAGRQTLAGIDSDNDGIRDDIQRWINEKYHNSPRSLAAAKQMAKAAQVEMLTSQDKQKSIQATYQYFDSMHCMDAITGLENQYKFDQDLTSRMQNTKDRIQTDIHNDANFNGQFVQSISEAEWASKCNFDVGSLPQ